MAWGWPGGRQVLLAAGLGAVMALGQAPVGAWYLTLPALAGLLWLVGRAVPKAGVWLAWFGGAGYFGLALNWIVQPFMVDAAKDGWMAPFALVFLAFGLALFWAGAAALAVPLRRPIWGFAVTLACAELARGYVLTGFPWALLGHVWIDTPVSQFAALMGPSGLGLLTLLCAAGLATRRGLAIAGAGAALAAAWGWGVWVLAQPAPETSGLTLRLVQPNAAQQAKWDPELAQMHMQRLLDLSEDGPPVDLVIWPETALPYLLDRHMELAEYIARAGMGAPVIIGQQRAEGDRYWNSLTVVNPDARLGPNYDKHHLVPFGEYIPFGDVLFDWVDISAFASQIGNGYTKGPGPQVLDLGRLGHVLPLICYEAVFPQDLRAATRPDWLLQITNDAWFGTWTGPFQHAAQARLRAIEQGLPLVRVANTGVTAVYDARGRSVAALPFGVEGKLDVTLPGAAAETPYARWGEGPVLVLLVGLGAAAFLRRKASNA